MSSSPSDDGVRERLRVILCELFALEPDEVRPESLLIGELGVDSIGLLDLTFTIEDRFDVAFPDPKADAQLLGLPLPDALRRLEQDSAGGLSLLGYVKQEAIRHATGGAEVTDERVREDIFAHQTLGDLGAAVGARIPGDLDPATPLPDIRIGHVFRAITVETIARYVEYLLAAKGAVAANP